MEKITVTMDKIIMKKDTIIMSERVSIEPLFALHLKKIK